MQEIRIFSRKNREDTMGNLKLSEYVQKEVKFIEIDVNDLERQLRKLGAIKVYHGPRKQIYFDYPNKQLTNNRSRVRVTIEDKIKLEYSMKMEDNTTAAIKVFVSREKEITDFLTALGLEQLYAVLSYRLSYEVIPIAI